MGDPVPDVEMTVAIRDGVLPTGPGLYYMSLYINSLMLPTSPSCLVSEETEPQTGYIACCRSTADEWPSRMLIQVGLPLCLGP